MTCCSISHMRRFDKLAHAKLLVDLVRLEGMRIMQACRLDCLKDAQASHGPYCCPLQSAERYPGGCTTLAASGTPNADTQLNHEYVCVLMVQYSTHLQGP